MKSLNIIGCGSVGRTMGRLWAEHSVFSIGDVLNRSQQSAKSAVSFMGAGRPKASLGQMKRADVFLIGAPDDRLADCCRGLADSGLLDPDNIVFHCSGAIRSAELGLAKERGASIASVHPVKSFADPALCVETFAGTYCGIEGDPDAAAVLSRSFEAVGGRMFSIDPEHKEIYHAASVFSCNYLTALLEIGLQAYARAGIARETAFAIVEPIVRETIDNVLKLDTTDALTGPIARGDYETVAKQIAALNAWEPDYCELYKRLGGVALILSRSQGAASEASLAALSRQLDH
jgi:predicted short-subunit dehydrogenase-like oxidoreductase (DUF2520 family)